MWKPHYFFLITYTAHKGVHSGKFRRKKHFKSAVSLDGKQREKKWQKGKGAQRRRYLRIYRHNRRNLYNNLLVIIIYGYNRETRVVVVMIMLMMHSVLVESINRTARAIDWRASGSLEHQASASSIKVIIECDTPGTYTHIHCT